MNGIIQKLKRQLGSIKTLDIFHKTLQNISNKLDAWLCFLSSEKLEDIEKVIEAYPEFEELYRQVFQFRCQTKELISMFSESLAIMDANTVKYMVEQQKKELEEQWEKLEKQRGMLEEQQGKLEEQQGKLEEQQGKLEEQQKELAEKDKEIQRLRALLEKRQ